MNPLHSAFKVETMVLIKDGTGSEFAIRADIFGDWAVHPTLTIHHGSYSVILDAWSVSHVPTGSTAGWCAHYAAAKVCALEMPRMQADYRRLFHKMGGSTDLDCIACEFFAPLDAWNEDASPLYEVSALVEFEKRCVAQ